MGWPVGVAFLGLLFLCAGVALLVFHHARVDDLRAVIRAQRRCMDQLETELLFPERMSKEAIQQWDRLGRLIQEEFHLSDRQDNNARDSQPAGAILELLRAHRGRFSIGQIIFLQQLVRKLRGALDHGAERQASPNPSSRLVFGSYGGWQIEPSGN